MSALRKVIAARNAMWKRAGTEGVAPHRVPDEWRKVRISKAEAAELRQLFVPSGESGEALGMYIEVDEE